jgi:hypothetical protein
MKGSLVQAQMGAQAVQDLNLTNAAQNARSIRQEANRRSLQSGGILYASDARAMVRKKEEKREADQVAAAQRALERAEEAEQKRQQKTRQIICKAVRKYWREKTKAKKAEEKAIRRFEA